MSVVEIVVANLAIVIVSRAQWSWSKWARLAWYATDQRSASAYTILLRRSSFDAAVVDIRHIADDTFVVAVVVWAKVFAAPFRLWSSSIDLEGRQRRHYCDRSRSERDAQNLWDSIFRAFSFVYQMGSLFSSLSLFFDKFNLKSIKKIK